VSHPRRLESSATLLSDLKSCNVVTVCAMMLYRCQWSASCPIHFTSMEGALNIRQIGGCLSPRMVSVCWRRENLFAVPGIQPQIFGHPLGTLVLLLVMLSQLPYTHTLQTHTHAHMYKCTHKRAYVHIYVCTYFF
jgi:hypothetical protein